MDNKTIIKRTIIISSVIIFIDQFFKIIAIKFCSDYKIEVIKNILYFNQIENLGVAFSLNSGNTKNIFITSIILIFILRYIFSQKKFLNNFTLTSWDLVLAGGISNLIDRIFRGAVIDFIEIVNFPVFNIADVIIVLGMISFIIYMIRVEFAKK